MGDFENENVLWEQTFGDAKVVVIFVAALPGYSESVKQILAAFDGSSIRHECEEDAYCLLTAGPIWISEPAELELPFETEVSRMLLGNGAAWVNFKHFIPSTEPSYFCEADRGVSPEEYLERFFGEGLSNE